jgi:hypothetical protein
MQSRMRVPTILTTLFVLLIGCAPRGADDANAPDTNGAPADQIDTTWLMQTAKEVRLRRDGEHLMAMVRYTYTNRTGGRVYLVNCNGNVAPSLQLERDTGWANWWGPATNACLSPPVIIEPGAVYRDSAMIAIASFDSTRNSEIFTATGPITVRFIWHQALSSYDADLQSFGTHVPLEQRVSHPIRLSK